MDGTRINEVLALGDVIESGMRQGLEFTTIRLQVAAFLKKQGCYVLGTERVGEKTYVIMVSYWDVTGESRTESFDEWTSYTRAHPVSTW